MVLTNTWSSSSFLNDLNNETSSLSGIKLQKLTVVGKSNFSNQQYYVCLEFYSFFLSSKLRILGHKNCALTYDWEEDLYILLSLKVKISFVRRNDAHKILFKETDKHPFHPASRLIISQLIADGTWAWSQRADQWSVTFLTWFIDVYYSLLVFQTTHPYSSA